MSRVADRDQSIARRSVSKARLALAAQPDLLAFLNADWDCDIKGLASRQRDASRAAGGGRRQGDGCGDRDVLAALGRAQTAARLGAEKLGQNVRIDPRAGAAAVVFAAAHIEIEMLEARCAAAARTRAAAWIGKAFEPLMARFALCINFAAIEGPALFLVANDLVSRID